MVELTSLTHGSFSEEVILGGYLIKIAQSRHNINILSYDKIKISTTEFG